MQNKYKPKNQVAHGAGVKRRHRQRKEPVHTALSGALLLVAVLFLSLSTVFIIEEWQAAGTVPGQFAQQAIPLPQEIPETAAEQEAETQPPLVYPTELAQPTGGWTPYTFTEEQTAQLQTVLDEWAASEQPVVEEASEETTETEASAQGVEQADPEEGHRVALYFQDLDSGAQYIYNGEEMFDVASLSKAPYALYLYQLVEQGAASLEETFLITPESIVGSEENSGILKDDENLPRELTLAEMIEYLLRYSDTVAQRVLLERYPASGYATWANELGVQNARTVTGDAITAPEAGIYLAALYEYMRVGVYGSELQEHLMNTRNPMIATAWPMARKYGWDEHAFHDMAVVYAAHPYLIAILTDKSVGANEDRQYFSTLPAMLEQMMNEHWATAEVQPANQKPAVA